MGVVTTATVIYANGTIERIQNLEQIAELSETGRVELEYEYNPSLLPSSNVSNQGMWRYQALLPGTSEVLYPLPVGSTPLIASSRLRAYTGLSALWIKDETRSPTGSNKDRATALILDHALHSGISTVSCASTGNAALSLAVGAAASGIEAVIFVPADVNDTKLQLMLLAGATVFKVVEGYEAAVKLSRLAAHTFGWYDRNTGYNPLTLEAKKTVALEIWEQLEYRIPDIIISPVGDGVTLSGLAKGFRELLLCGATHKLPRIIGVQARGCQPLKLAWEKKEPVIPGSTNTIADGIAVPAPVNAAMALRDVHESLGSFVSVEDDTICQAITTLLTQGGIFSEPAGAAAFAGIEASLAQGLIKRDDLIVVLVTGSGTKHLPHVSASKSKHAYTIHADLHEVQRILIS